MPSFPATVADRQYTAPAAADGATITAAGGGAWNPSAWVTLLASAPTDGLLTGITVRATSINYYGGVGSFEIDIAVGATPTIIATFKGFRDARWGGCGSNQCLYLPCPIAVEGIAAGEAVKARLRQQHATDTSDWHVSMTYLRLPLTGVLESTAQPQLVLPAAAGLVELTTPVTPWADTGWASLGASGDRVLVGLVLWSPQAGMSMSIDIGDDTTVRATVHAMSMYTNQTELSVIALTPLRVTGELRVRARGRISATVALGATYFDVPL